MLSNVSWTRWLSGLGRRISGIQPKRGWGQGRMSRSHVSELIGWNSSCVGAGRLFENVESLEERALLSTTCTVTGGANAENLPVSDGAVVIGAADTSLTAGNVLTDAQREAIEQVVRDSTNQIGFEKNVGQFPDGVSYGFRTTFGATLVYQNHVRLISRQADSVTQERGQQVVDINFTGSNARWAVVPGDASEVLGSYQQTDGTALRPEIFNEVTLRNVYDGVDLRLYSADNGILEFDWIVARAQDYEQIRIAANGQDGIVFNDDGSAMFDLRFQDLTLKIPETYQVIDGVKHPLDARMVAGDSSGEIRYAIAGDIVNDQPLVIDPNVAWSTFFDLNSSTFDEYLFAVAVNANGVYAFGLSNQQITNAVQGPGGNNYMQVNAGFSQGTASRQAYIYRLDGAGANITAWTSTGISGTPADLELFPDGRVLAGFSDGRLQIYSGDLATRSFTGEPVTTSSLNSLAVVDNDSFYVGGRVSSAIPAAQIATSNIGPDATAASTEAVIIRYSNATATPAPSWATYVGGSGVENFTAIAMTPNRTKLVFAVNTASTAGFPGLVNEVDGTVGGSTELLVGVLNEQATVPAAFDVFSYLGGSSTEGTSGAATAQIVATNAFFYVGGNTSSTDLPGTTGGAQASKSGGVDLFMSRIPLNGNAGSGFQSTYAGGTGTDTMGGLAYDLRADKLHVFATTTGSFPTQNTTPASSWFDSTFGGGTDIVVATYSSDLTTKEFASYIGGNSSDYLGSTGTLVGQGHLVYSDVTGLTYLGTTSHSSETTLDPSTMSNVPGKDKVESNRGNDAHFLIAFNGTTFDFGDAPASYESGNAARESTSAQIRIGATIDSEGAPFSSVNADGDDLIDSGATDDEDGVASLPQLNINSTIYSVTATVFNNTGVAQTLHGWIDFNRNGTFQASEIATVSVPTNVSQQNVVLSWAGLSGLVGGQSYLRLRLTTAVLTDNASTAALDERSIAIGSIGEVEDYSLLIQSFSINIEKNVSVTEGAGSAVFTVTLNQSSGQTVTVDFATANGTALASSDYTAISGTLTFLPGETSMTITVPILGDSTYEGDESFIVNLSNATNSSIIDGQGQATITDDDPAPGLTINNVTIVEDNAGTQDAVFTVTLATASALPVTVDYATADGSATSGSDFLTKSGTLTFAPGETSQTVTVAVNGDTTYEAAEFFFVNLSGATNAFISDGQGQGTITDNDPPPKISIDDVTVIEGTGNAVNAVFTVSLTNASYVPVTLKYTTAKSTAISPEDFTAGSGTVTFAPGETSQTITVSIVSDSLDEVTETFFVNLTSPTNATITDGQGLGTILDDDTSGLSVSDVLLMEGSGTTVNAVFTVSLSQPSTLPVSVDYTTANGTAFKDFDYLYKHGKLVFGPGQTSKTVVIPIKSDKIDESDEEVFFFNLTAANNATIVDGQGQCTITDDDSAPTVSIKSRIVKEGTGSAVKANFTVSLSAASGLPVTVDYATADDSAAAATDYTSVSGTLSFAPGQKSKTITVLVAGDALHELNENFLINLTGSTNATFAVSQAVGTITDNDAIPKLSINNPTITEGNNGTVDLVFTVTLSAASGLPVTVNYATTDGTANATDYTSVNGSLTFNAGETTKTITVSILGDAIAELKKTFSLNLSGALNALFANSKGIGTILDND